MVDISKIDSSRLSGNVEPGDICYSLRTTKDGWLLCDGSEVSRENYKNLFEVIGTTFGEGDGTLTFNLPNYKGRFLQMVSNDQTIGSNVEAGLPNITGNFSVGSNQTSYLKGAFYSSDSGNADSNGGAGTSGGGFDASRSNPIYGNSNTVQPPSSLVNYFIKY